VPVPALAEILAMADIAGITQFGFTVTVADTVVEQPATVVTV
jgi:hypothetical protein